jgi:hypothetical protein
MDIRAELRLCHWWPTAVEGLSWAFCGLSAALDTGPDDEDPASHPGERAGCTGRRIGPVVGIGQECRLGRTGPLMTGSASTGGTVRLTGGPRLVLGATGPHEEGTISRVVPGVKSTARHRDSASQRCRQQGHTACPIAAHYGTPRPGGVSSGKASVAVHHDQPGGLDRRTLGERQGAGAAEVEALPVANAQAAQHRLLTRGLDPLGHDLGADLVGERHQ